MVTWGIQLRLVQNFYLPRWYGRAAARVYPSLTPTGL
jgi:hypothetical protein